MHRRARTALTFLAGGLVGAMVAVPAVASAATGPSHTAARPAAPASQAVQSAVPDPQRDRMADQCRQTMRTPQMRRMHQQMMNDRTPDSMMNSSMMGGRAS